MSGAQAARPESGRQKGGAARATVERHGYTILANVGDQRSDLAGGHSLRRYKLPNPVYLIS